MQEENFSSRRSSLIFIFLIVVNLFFLTAHLNVYVKTLKYFFYYIVNPGPMAAEKVVESSGRLMKNIKNIIYIHRENEELKEQIKKYSYLEKDYSSVFEENERLKKIAGISFSAEKNILIARVVVRDSSNWFEWVIIDKGYNDGLFVDAPVLAWVGEKLVVLGRVWEVYEKSSKVILITNTLCSIPVEIKYLNEDGLIEGQNNPVLKMKYLLTESSVKTGDEVVTSPVSQVFPSGITVGYVKSVFAPDKNKTLKVATVKPVFSSTSLKIVTILIPKRNTR